MKKYIVCIFCILFVASISPAAFGMPEVGTWNGTTTGLGDEFDGIFAVYSEVADADWAIGDELEARDNSDESTSYNPYYWAIDGMLRDTFVKGAFVDNGDETGYTPFTSTFSGGTLYIRGDNLWGHDPGTVYTVSIEGETSATAFSKYTEGSWVRDYIGGYYNCWGTFNEDPFLFEFTAEVYTSENWVYNETVGMWIYPGKFNNVEMRIASIPEPSTLLLLGFGLIGLVRLRRKL